MARFYVGQRVRIVAGPLPIFPEFIGAEAAFIHYGAPIGSALERTDDCVIQVRGALLGANSGQLEPIIDPGREVISWEEMADLWTPEKVSA